MALKYGRNYALYIAQKDAIPSQQGNSFDASILNEQSPGFILVKPPFTIEFDIQRSTLASASASSIKIYNLARNRRNQIFQPQINTGSSRKIQLQAGYGKNTPVVFTGNIREAWSVRVGNNFITQAESFDGGFAYSNSPAEFTYTKGTTDRTLIKEIIKRMAGVSEGTIGNYPTPKKRGGVITGSCVSNLYTIAKGGFFVDNGRVNCLNEDECVSISSNVVGTINSSSGLLGTPKIEGGAFVVITMLFEPSIVMGQQVQLDSKTFGVIPGSNPNSIYKVVGIQHRGTISDTVCGEAITTLKLSGGLNFKAVDL